MIGLPALALVLALGAAQAPAPSSSSPPAGEVIAGIRVHGNTATPDADIVRLSGLVVGASFTDAALADARRRLEATHDFVHVQVSKRYASIADLSQVLVLIVVDEGAVSVDWSGAKDREATVVRRRGFGRHFMWLPIVDGEDGYGLTYGARVAYVGLGPLAGPGGRLSFPLTWGGTKQAAVEFDRPLASGPLTRVQVGVGLDRRRNPAFDEDDSRRRVWARAERRLGDLRAGVIADRQHVSFADRRDTMTSYGADVTYDTRVDPLFPRNAVDLTASWTARRFGAGGVVHQTTLDGRAYVGVVGQSVIVARVSRESADAPLPPYVQPLVGGWENLRGFRAGAFAGDTAVTGSLELRVPLSSPLRVARFGVSAFVDTGTAYAHGARLSSQPMHVGVGGGIWWTATVFHLGISAAHGIGATTRVNFGGGLAF
jgi:outer membrane protein assembly factor BamA